MSDLDEDPPYRNLFVIDDPTLCYLDGNSLGRLPKTAVTRIQQVVQQGWGSDLIGGWNADWIDLPQRIGDKLSEVVGCQASEIIMADSTSVNLFKLATAALRQQSGRRKVLTEAANFPSDAYVLASAMEAAGGGRTLEVVGTADQIMIETEEVVRRIDSDTALVCLSHVAFKSGQLHDLRAITSAAHASGALVLWDLSHSVGAVPVDLTATGVDLAVGCTYKFLCGGPGAPAFLYCREDLQSQLANPIAGWFSHRAPFEFAQEYRPADGIERFLTGTPPVLSLAAVEAGVDIVRAAGSDWLRQRSLVLTQYLLEQIQRSLLPLGFELRSPLSPEQRGSHISIGHREARRITENVIQRHRVVPDFRRPDSIRLGVSPLQTTRQELDRALQALEVSVREREYASIKLPSAPVT